MEKRNERFFDPSNNLIVLICFLVVGQPPPSTLPPSHFARLFPSRYYTTLCPPWSDTTWVGFFSRPVFRNDGRRWVARPARRGLSRSPGPRRERGKQEGDRLAVRLYARLAIGGAGSVNRRKPRALCEPA